MKRKLNKILKKSIAIALSLFLLPSVAVLVGAEQADSVQLPTYTRKLMDLIKSSQNYDDLVSSAEEIKETEDFRAMRLIVKMKDGKVKETYGAEDVVEMPNGITVLQYETESQARYAHKKYSSDEAVKYCINDRLQRVETNLIIEDTVSAQAETTETGEYLSWGVERVGADQYMEKLPDAKDLPEIIVAVLDTGVDLNHPFLKDRLIPGYDFYNDDADPSDDNMHGTFCSGIVADATKENVKIMPVKLLSSEGDCDIYMSTDLAAVTFAVDNGADIISMSFGYHERDVSNYEYYNDIISYATDRDVLCVAAMGNWGNSHDNLLLNGIYDVPAICENVLSVGATDVNEIKASFSDYGSNMELVAPGVGIRSCMLGGGYTAGSGTSASTPLVAACAALLFSDNPDMSYTDICNELYERAADREAPGKDIYYGYGRVDIGETVKMETMSFGYSESHVYTEHFPIIRVINYPEFSPLNTTDGSITIYSTNPEVAYFDADGNGNYRTRLNILSAGTAKIVAVSTDGHLISSYDLYVYECEKPEVKVKTLPNKTEYFVGEMLNTDGLSLELIYRNKTSEIITEGFTCENIIFDTAGAQSVKINYQDLSCTFNVMVYDEFEEPIEELINVSGIELTKKLSLAWNESDYLIATIKPDNAKNKNVIWTSSDESVATVDQNGKVTAVGRGTTIITAATEDGGYKAECEVTVKFTWWQWIFYILFFGFIWM